MGYTDVVDPIPATATLDRRTIKLKHDNIPVTKLPLLRGETDAARGFNAIDSVIRELAARITNLETVVRAAGVAPVIATMARQVDSIDDRYDSMAQPKEGMFVHIAPDTTARLAVNTTEGLWANGIITRVIGAGKIECYSIGSWPGKVKPLTGALGGRLFLSNLPGFAQDTEPLEAGSIRQQLGSRLTDRDGAGACLINCNLGEFVLL